MTSGIHPDLTGRENVFLYGAVLGMRRKISRERFDEIVEFAGLADAIDRQVKFFSLGMQMRLGFSIAAFSGARHPAGRRSAFGGRRQLPTEVPPADRRGRAPGHHARLRLPRPHRRSRPHVEQSLWLADAVVQAAGPTREVAALYRKSVEQDASVATSNDGVVRMLKSSITGPDGGQVLSLEDAEVR